MKNKPKQGQQPIVSDDALEHVVAEVAKKDSPYRDERGVRIQKYRRFKEGEDYDKIDAKDMVVMTQSVLENLDQLREDIRIGRPRKYETVDEFIDIAKAYIQYIQDANIDDIRLIPDIEGLCAYMNISRETLNEWERSRLGVYSDAIKSVKNYLAFCKKQLALKGKIPPIVFATDFNNNHGYTQKQQIEVAVGNPLGPDSDPTTMAQKYQNALPGVTIASDAEND